jgi:hypothetical protein
MGAYIFFGGHTREFWLNTKSYMNSTVRVLMYMVSQFSHNKLILRAFQYSLLIEKPETMYPCLLATYRLL